MEKGMILEDEVRKVRTYMQNIATWDDMKYEVNREEIVKIVNDIIQRYV